MTEQGGRVPRAQLLATLAAGFLLAAAAAFSIHPLAKSVALDAANAPAGGAADAYASLPLSFVPNEGQIDKSVRFYAQSGGRSFYFTRDKVVLSFAGEKKSLALDLAPLGANPNARLEGAQRAQGRVNFLNGPERHTNLPTYREVAYLDLWPGIDLVFRGGGGKLKYEFRLQPGADPSKIALAYRGADRLSLATGGILLIHTPLGTLKDTRPRSYQRVNGKNVPVASSYALTGGSSAYGFTVGAHDPGRPLVIDPGLVYSTYLGGQFQDEAHAIAVDSNGNAYVTGASSSSLFPTTVGVYDTQGGPGLNTFVTKLNAAGSGLVYSTFIGGAPNSSGAATVVGEAIAIDGAGNAYVAGWGAGGIFTTPGAFQSTQTGNAGAFVIKLNASGTSELYATQLGGGFEDHAWGIDIDGSGNAYVTGDTKSSDFPTTAGAYDTTLGSSGLMDAFVTKLNSSGTAALYSTYLGGADHDVGNGIVVDGAGKAYVTGRTDDSNFPTTVGALDTSMGGIQDAFVTKLNAAGSALDYSTFLGGSGGEAGLDVDIDGTGNSYLTGVTSSNDFPATAGAFDTTHNGGGGFADGYVAKLNPAGSALGYATYLGGAANEIAPPNGTAPTMGIAADASGSAWVTGGTPSSDFPTIAGAVDTSNPSGQDAFATKVSQDGSALVYSTFLGGGADDQGFGVAVDGDGVAHVAGFTASTDFPTTPGAFDTTQNGGVSDNARDGFVTALDDDEDGDGLPEVWETQGLTVGGDFVDLPAMGADPEHKDIFVEVDFMSGKKPDQAAINRIITSFDDASVLNPDNTQGIHLHVDNGASSPLTWAPGNWDSLSKQDSVTLQTNLGSGGGTTMSPYNWAAFDAIKNANFTAARKPIFHYNLWANKLSTAMGNTSGIARAIPTSDFIVSLGGWTFGFGSTDEQAGTFMHELGHNLGLRHGGGTDVQWKPNYLSVMNYSFQTTGVIVTGLEGNFDYSETALPQLDETNLNENNGVGTGMGTVHYCDLDKPNKDPDGTKVDWNCDGDDTDTGVSKNINQGVTGNTDTDLTQLNGYDDWPNLVFNGGAVGSLGNVTLPSTTVAHELTAEEAALIPRLQATYARPASATPLRVPLAPAYQQCTSPNSTHVSPLSLPSCSPPVLESTQLKMGSAGQGSGFVRFKVQLGNLNTPTDESDVAITATARDVRKASDSTDYTGQVVLAVRLRTTDKRNGPSTADSATIQDGTLGIPISCTATPGSAGSTCSVTTTADTLVPGFAPENKRVILSMPSVTVLDAGPDGSITPPSGSCPPTCGSGDEGTFLREGLFTP